MPSWPTTLPDYLMKDALSETLPANTIRSSMEVGPAKVRRRATSAVRLISGKIKLTAAQAADLDTFYSATTQCGSIQFDWKHPRTRAAVNMRFVGPPVIVPYGAEGNRWAASLQLEVLP